MSDTTNRLVEDFGVMIGSAIEAAVNRAVVGLQVRIARLEADNTAGINYLEDVARRVMEPVVDRVAVLENEVSDRQPDTDYGEFAKQLSRTTQFQMEVDNCTRNSTVLVDEVRNVLDGISVELRV